MKKSSAPANPQPFDGAENPSDERPNAFWYRIYLAVAVTTVFVIAALWTFSQVFSK